MKVGDLVKMKYENHWRLKERGDYTISYAIVLERYGPAVKVLMPDGRIKSSLASEWDIINEKFE